MLPRLILWTVLVHGPFASAVFRLGLLFGCPSPALASLAISALCVAVVPVVVPAMVPDRLRSSAAIFFASVYLAHWTACSIATLLAFVSLTLLFALRWLGLGLPLDPSTLSAACYLLSAGLCLHGAFFRRARPITRVHSFAIRGLGARFHGYRIVHISDLHIGSFARDNLTRRWASLINRHQADLVLVTGDLVSSGHRYLPLVRDFLSSIRARDGVVVSPGNHDYFSGAAPLFDAITSSGAILLRNQSLRIERGTDQLAIVGLDDPCTQRADLARAFSDVDPSTAAIVLAHDPVIFPACARRHVPLTLSGHTHGGQIAFPFLARWLNIRSFSIPYSLGVYRQGDSLLVVNAGLGTSGPPVRIGAAPEIVVICLQP